MENTIFDFTNVIVAKGTDPLAPGQYVVESIDTELIETGKSPYLKTVFYDNSGKRVTRNFFISPKALVFLQYIHEQIMGKPITKAFQSHTDVANYFTKIFEGYSNKKTPNRVGMIVGKKIANDGKVYSNLTDYEFLVNLSEDTSFEAREYTDEDLAANKYLVMKDDYKPEQTQATGTFVSTIPQMPSYTDSHVVMDTSELPF